MKLTYYGEVVLFISQYLIVAVVTLTTQETVVEETQEGSIRLTNGNETFGRVEIFLDNQWGTICDDGWEFIDAIVICRQLGFKTANIATSGNFPDDAPGVIHLESLNCHGNEESILDCRFITSHDCSDIEAIDVGCTDYEHGDLRIVEGNATTGLVQIFLDGELGGICSDGWNLESANVTCRQLGFNDVLYLSEDEGYLGDRGESFYLNDVNCTGDETALVDCYFTQSENCIGDSYAGVVCLETVLHHDGDLRLQDGSETSGRVEVFIDGNWGTICDDGWDLVDSLIACRQLGFKNSVRYFTQGQGSGFIHFDEVQCLGYEQKILDCNYTVAHDCTFHEDVGVSCVPYDEGDIRLNGQNLTSGLVEIMIDNQWGYICGDEWGLEEAEVACRQLGFDGIASVDQEPLKLDYVVHFRGFSCTGDESSILDCTPLSGTDCTKDTVTAVSCIPVEEGRVRLVNGPDQYAGRVEMYSRGAWGTICDDDWDLFDSNVVCRQLGYGNATVPTVSSIPFGPGSGPIHLRIVLCRGDETALTSCNSMFTYCSHNEDAGVVCEKSSFNTNFPVRLVGGLAGQYSGRVEVFIENRWRTICGEDWNIKGADVVCKQLGYGWALNAEKERRKNTTIALFQVACEGNEITLSQCDYPSIGVPHYGCSSEEEALVTCSGTCLNGRCPANIKTILESPSQETTRVFWAEPSLVSPFCERVEVFSSHSPGQSFREGVTVVSYFVENTDGVRAECSFTVSVTRKTCRNITCPPDVMTSLQYKSDSTVVFWGGPSSADDSCKADSLTSSHSPGDEFLEGATVVTYFYGDTIVCNFTVEVTKGDRPFSLAAPIVPPVAIALLLLFFCLFWVLKMPKRLPLRPLPSLPKHRQPSFVNPAYQPDSPVDKDNNDAGEFYDFILEEDDFVNIKEITDLDTYCIGRTGLNEDEIAIVKSQDYQVGQNGTILIQQGTESHSKVQTEPGVDCNHLKDKENEYSIDPGDNTEHYKQVRQRKEGETGNGGNEDHYVVMKGSTGSDVTEDQHRGEGHERAILDKLAVTDNTDDVLVLNLGEF